MSLQEFVGSFKAPSGGTTLHLCGWRTYYEEGKTRTYYATGPNREQGSGRTVAEAIGDAVLSTVRP